MKVTTKAYIHAKQTERYDSDALKFVETTVFELWPCDMSGHGERVLVGEQEVEVDVPEGFDMRSGLVKNLEAEKKRLMAEFQARVTAIDNQIQKYLAIEAPVSEVVS
jgi:hypothetical protein